jgi:stearoyl-CoA desaturase (delta-9 desaturase)
MAEPFLRRVLHTPHYGWTDATGALSRPDTRAILREWRARVDLFASRKAWLPVANWFWALALIPFGVVFLTRYFSWWLMLVGFLYSMVWLGAHGTVWLHRYCTHRAFTFRNGVYRWIFRNLAIKIIAEEIYVVSHHVHHAFSEKPGDPYNVNASWLYCFLAGELHQPINRDLSREDYERLLGLLRHTGIRLNSYAQYQRWGSVAHPAGLVVHFALNWAFWYGVFYLIGGHALATAIFGWSAVWGIGIRAHNWDLHGGGKDKRRAGVDFDDRSLAINAVWPGLVAGEWHNNHHLFPNSVRAGFLWWQVDISFALIRVYKLLGGVVAWRDFRDKFFERHYEPYRARVAEQPASAALPAARDGGE